MSKTGPTFNELKQEVGEIKDRFPSFDSDDAFVVWFLRAYVTESETDAAKAITGGAKDKCIDALLIDDTTRSVFIVQGKYRQKLAEKNEASGDVKAFADLANLLHCWDDAEFNEFLAGTDHAVAERLRLVRKKIKKDKYRTWLYFVTTGKVSPLVSKEAQQKVRQAGEQSRIEIIGGKRAMLLFRDYLDGVAPPIPTLDLEMESGAGVTVNGVAQRFDHAAKVESWVFSMRGDAVAALFDRAGTRLFARNIRGFMGMKTPVNQGMVATLNKEPERFFYYNNGITIVCDEAERKASQGRDLLQVGNPQIINGQQTTRTLAAFPRLAAKASVLVKVIQVPRSIEGDGEAFEELVSRIVAGTNWQNAIKASDLMSNDRKQIELERALRKIGYLYLRKRQSKGEAARVVGKGQFMIVRKEEFAQAVAGCDLDPYIIRAGRENLFNEDQYAQVFPNTDPDYYLTRYRLMRVVTQASKGVPQRGYAKWLVLNFMWSHIGPILNGKQKRRAFRKICEKKHNALTGPIYRAVDEAFIEAIKYWRANRGEGDAALDVSLFFKNRKGHHNQFRDHWNGISVARRDKFDKQLAAVAETVAQYDD
jgi:hypothetical protein